MGDYISELPDDIFCYLLLFLTVRDAVRVKSLSCGWNAHPDCRPVLLFDSNTIFGEEYYRGSPARKSKFVKAVNQYLKLWGAKKATALKIEFDLGNEYASHIDGWIASVAGKEVEDLNLNFLYYTEGIGGKYVFPCHLLHTENSSYLKHLSLKFCDLKLISNGCTSWASQLVTLELAHVDMLQSDMEHILSSSLQLESLSLKGCCLKGYLCVQHPSLKKLVIHDECQQVELSCPHLETFKYAGRSCFRFSHVPLLKEVSLKLFYQIGGCSSVFCDLAKNVPQLQALSLWVTTEVPPLNPSMTISCLKRLDFLADVPAGFDLFTIMHMVYASPALEELRLKLNPRRYSEKHPQKQYADRPHQLKEVIIEGLSPRLAVMGFAEYLLRNGSVLQQMVFVVGAKVSPILSGHPKFAMLQQLNSSVQLIVI